MLIDETLRPSEEDFESLPVRTFKIKHLVGSGSFSHVYKALVGTGETVALKVQRKDAPGDSSRARDMMIMEAKSLMQLAHPCIIRCLDVCKIPNNNPGLKGLHPPEAFTMVLEFMDSGSLTRLVYRRLQNPNSTTYGNTDALWILLDVARALAHLHKQKPPLVHRDVKQENILLTQEPGERVRAKIIDLGLIACLDETTKPRLLRQRLGLTPSMSVISDKEKPSPFIAAEVQHVAESEDTSAHRCFPKAHAFATPFTGNSEFVKVMPGDEEGSDGARERKETLKPPAGVAARRFRTQSACLPENVDTTACEVGGSRNLRSMGRGASMKVRSTLDPDFSSQAQLHFTKLSLGQTPLLEHVPSVRVEGHDKAAGRAHQKKRVSARGHDLRIPAQAAPLFLAIAPEFQWVYQLTGETGSCMYMAPEVFRNEPYNQSADVFSFGVLMYEVMNRTLLAVQYMTEFGQPTFASPEDYAEAVSNGFRPHPPRSSQNISDGMWALITDCWHQDPIARPSIEVVLGRLNVMLDQCPPTNRRVVDHAECCTIC